MQDKYQEMKYMNELKIGTEVLDGNLPSQINFNTPPKKKYPGNVVITGSLISPPKVLKRISNNVRAYRIKGVGKELPKPKYHPRSIISSNLTTFEVKSFDDARSNGIKSLWQAMVGYSKRYLCFLDGWMYVLERTGSAYLVHSLHSFLDIFKIFIDPEYLYIRFVIKCYYNKLVNRDYQVTQFAELTDMLSYQINTVGLMLCY